MRANPCSVDMYLVITLVVKCGMYGDVCTLVVKCGMYGGVCTFGWPR